MDATDPDPSTITGLHRRRWPLDPIDLRHLFAALQAQRRGPLLYLEHRVQGQLAQRLTIGEALSISPTNDGPPRLGDAYRRAMALLHRLDVNARDALSFVGWQAFDTAGERSALWAPFGSQRFFLPRQTLDVVNGEAWLTTLRYQDGPVTDALSAESLQTLATSDVSPPSARAPWTQANLSPTRRDDFRNQVTLFQDHPFADKVVLARRRHIETDQPIAVDALLAALSEGHPQCTTFAIWPGDNAPVFTGATPENLITVQGGTLSTMALAGTTRNNRPDHSQGLTLSRDDAESELLNSTKDRDEHQFVVDMIADNLRPFCHHLTIPDEPTVKRLKDLSHLQTPIGGTLRDDAFVTDLVDALHPTPAVCGVPRRTAQPLIAELESFDRGLYAGTFGQLDSRGDGRFEVALRCALVDGDQALLYAGAGLTNDSDTDVEFDEIEDKFATMTHAINEVTRG